MAVHKLFPSYSWTRSCPAPFNDPSITARSKNTACISKYNTTSTPVATLHPPTLRALMAYMDIDPTVGTPDPASNGAVGEQGENLIVAEYPGHSESTHVVVFNRNTGKFASICVSDTGDTLTPYSLTETERDGAALIFALLPLALEDEEFSRLYISLAQEHKADYPDMDNAVNIAYKICDNLYRRITNATSLATAGIEVEIPTTNITRISQLKLDKGEYSPNHVIAGTFRIFTVDSGAKTKSYRIAKHEDFVGKYGFANRTFTALEQKLIPDLPISHELAAETVELCQHALETTKSTTPMRKFMLRGSSGTGKTEASRAVAAGLGLPYVIQTCAADFDFASLIGSFVPDSNNSAVCELEDEELPSFADIRIDPATAYEMLTKEYNEDVTEEEVYQKLLEVIASRTATHYKEDGGIRYKYTETPLIQAMRNGWVVELQEPSVILNQGALVGLNGLLDQCRQIVLPTGEVLPRHPDAVLIITTNMGYVGCRNFNQSVLSRMDLIFDFDDLEPEKMVRRAAKVTGFDDAAIMKNMEQVVQLIQNKCKAEHITDGTCGVRQIINWMQSYQINKSVLQSARRTVIPYISQDADVRDDIDATCLEAVIAA